MNLNLVPVNERIIVIPKKADETSKGIFIPSTSRERSDEKPEVGFVIAIDVEIEKPKCKLGDKIVFNKFAATDMTTDGQRVLLMLDSSVIAVYTNVDEEERKKYLDGDGNGKK